MSKNSGKINAFFDGFDERFRDKVPNVIAETATEYYQDRFNEQEWNGVPWQPLNEEYARKKTRGKGRILTRTSNLQKSIRPETVTANRVTISAGNAKVPYARAHNEGEQISGVQYVRPHTKKNFMGKQKAVSIKGHDREVNFKMPKRQFMGFNRELKDKIMNRLRMAFTKK